MQHFTGSQYLQIDLANCYGLDRLTWQERLDWFDLCENKLEQMDTQAKFPILFRKAIRAWRDHQAGKAVNHIIGLDATASGLQIMGALSNCVTTCEATNLVYTGQREDVYEAVARAMRDHGCSTVTRDMVKKPVMTVFYGSKAQPKQIFGNETPELFAFYDALKEKLPGAFELMDILQSYWRSDVLHHQWKLPDGHVARVPVTETVDKSLEIDEADHMRVTYRTKVLHEKARSRALAANIIHSIDAMVVRQMVGLAQKNGYWLAPIHDCFYCHPNYMNDVRENYVKIMLWIARNNPLQDILSQIAGYKVRYQPRSSKLACLIPHAEYALS